MPTAKPAPQYPWELPDFRVRGFTFHRPWGEAAMRPVPKGARAPSPKNIDNRPNAPNVAARDNWIAIHTGQKVDAEGLKRLREDYDYPWTRDDLSPAGMILGVVKVEGYVFGDKVYRLQDGAVREAPVEGGPNPWYFGPEYKGKPNWGWLFGDVTVFPKAVWCPTGMMGLWHLPEDAYGATRDQWLSARGASHAGA